MNEWNELVKLGMLGTEKGRFTPELLPSALQSYFHKRREQSDPEGDFLKAAALLLAFRRAGTQAATPPFPRVDPAKEEEQPYVSFEQHSILKKLIAEESSRDKELIVLWLEHCAARGRIVLPDVLPDLLDIQSAFTHFPYFNQILGKRGQWLSSQQDKWKLSATSMEQIWQEGNTAERNELIRRLLDSDTQQAIQYIIAGWPYAHVKERITWLKGLNRIRTDHALEFVESTYQKLHQSGTKGKESIEQLLALHAAYLISQPSSKLFFDFQTPLQNLIKRGKGFLGLREKITIELPTEFDDFFNEKLNLSLGVSIEKKLSPSAQIEAWFSWIIAHIHPSCWEAVLGNEWRQIFPLFPPQYHLPLAHALGKAARKDALKVFITLSHTNDIADDVLTELRNKDLLHHHDSSFAQLKTALEILPTVDIEKFISSLNSKQIGYFYQSFPEIEGEWSLKTSLLLYNELFDLDKDQFAFQKYILKQGWRNLNLGILSEMAKKIKSATGYSPETTLVNNYIKPLYHLLSTKQSIQQAFHNN